MTLIPTCIIALAVGAVVIAHITISFTPQQWALAGLGAFLFILFVATPTRIGVRYIRLLTPKLVLDDSLTDVPSNYTGRIWSIGIQNTGKRSASNCQGQLVAVARRVKDEASEFESWPTQVYLRWAAGTHLNADKSHSIPGCAKARLDIIEVFPPILGSQNPANITFTYDEADSFKVQHNLPSASDMLFVVKITTVDAADLFAVFGIDHTYITKPVLGHNDVVVDHIKRSIGFQVKLLALTEKEPILANWQQ